MCLKDTLLNRGAPLTALSRTLPPTLIPINLFHAGVSSGYRKNSFFGTRDQIVKFKRESGSRRLQQQAAGR